MLGAIFGDIVGSRFEWNNIKSKDFFMYDEKIRPTDDSIMTMAIAKALLRSKDDFSDLAEQSKIYMRKFGMLFPNAGYGGSFRKWLYSDDPKPYNSWGNGSAMRVSPCGFAAKSLEQAKELARITASVTHNHPEGIKGAEATAAAIYLARTGSSKEEIKNYICKNYYDIDFTLDEIRDTYEYDISCQGTVPYALEAFFESENFEDAIRNAISIGGDSDTLAAITGGIAEAYFGMPDGMAKLAQIFLPKELKNIVVYFKIKFRV